MFKVFYHIIRVHYVDTAAYHISILHKISEYYHIYMCIMYVFFLKLVLKNGMCILLQDDFSLLNNCLDM